MNEAEHKMVVGAEEAGEVAVAAMAVAKALSKMMRFGTGDTNPERGVTAAQVLVAELNDLEAAVEMLAEAGVPLVGLHDRGAIDAKKAKVEKYMEYAEAAGALQRPTSPNSCPFCGGEQIGIGYVGQPATSFYAYCHECGARGPCDRGMRSGSGVCDTTSCVQSAYDLFVKRPPPAGFEARPAAEELTACQRYFESGAAGATGGAA